MTDLLTTYTNHAARELNQRLEYELRGAWRAGYDYLHLYDGTQLSIDPDSDGTDPPRQRFTIGWAVIPSTHPRPPRHQVGNYRYSQTYLLDDEHGFDATWRARQ